MDPTQPGCHITALEEAAANTSSSAFLGMSLWEEQLETSLQGKQAQRWL